MIVWLTVILFGLFPIKTIDSGIGVGRPINRWEEKPHIIRLIKKKTIHSKRFDGMVRIHE